MNRKPKLAAEAYFTTGASRIKTHFAAPASLKFKLRFAGELQTKPVRQILSICAIKFNFHLVRTSHAKPR
ncbi:hypothetical protein CAMGR0001_1333 [Campylobacter gracilis RM3268]|uniref:Uncharacterized protein n=1 Tax=Campylobacter gracilis RM3268 TaxID=553220 RepID=C8PJD4_9BACT|nr:hypothetical protein CAMGR0001_1333 [Campylobacter gracilis RM3268]